MLLIVEETESGDSHEVPDTEPGPVRCDHFHCDLDVARLNQPSIATLPDEVHSQSPDLPELLGRRTLRQILRAEGALPSEHAIRIFLATWKALHRVHGLGAALIEHRRFSRKVVLTSAGRRVFEYAGRLLALADETKAAVKTDEGIQISAL